MARATSRTADGGASIACGPVRDPSTRSGHPAPRHVLYVAPMTAAPTHADEWTGEGVRVSEIERELMRLREASMVEDAEPDLRTSVLTHIAWVPGEWREAATRTLAGLAERHPSRTILLNPDPEADVDRLDANVSLQCFPLRGSRQHVCSEVIDIFLRGRRANVPASVVTALCVSDLPVFLRWRGQPPFGTHELEQLVGLADRLVVESGEWPDLPAAYSNLSELFERIAVSDIAWSRTLDWRVRLASLWPGISEVQEVAVTGPYADALLLAGWLRSRLGREVELIHEPAQQVEAISVDGDPVEPPLGDLPTPSDLLSHQLDQFGRDRIYEAAARAA